jgi:hypothetical protein
MKAGGKFVGAFFHGQNLLFLFKNNKKLNYFYYDKKSKKL